MASYCAIKLVESVNKVINRIVWDGQTPYTYPDPEVTLVASEIGQINDKYENSKFYYYDDWTDPQNPVWVERV
jgi:hypothetical protein